MFEGLEKIWIEELLEEKIEELEAIKKKSEAVLNDLEALKSALEKVKNLD